MKILKNKKLYIALLVIFSLILVATLIIRFAVPSKSSSSDTASVPGGFSGMPGGDFSGDFSGMSGGDFSSFDPNNMPEGFDMSNLPQGGFDMSNMPQGGDFSGFQPGNGSFGSNRPGRSSSSENSGFLGAVRKFWIPITIICVLVDAACAYMIVRLTKEEKEEAKRKAMQKKGRVQKAHEEETNDEPRRKKNYWILIPVVIILIIAIVLKTLPLGKKDKVSSVTVKEKVLSADVAMGAISKVYLSGGVLAVEDAVSVSLPDGIMLDSYAVSDGEIVEAGDLIAVVNKASVLEEIREVETYITELDGKIADELDDDEDAEKITASADGRVKAVYAEAGKSVVDTMAENGALLVLSLDGLMEAQIPSGYLAVGNKVTVVLPDETEETGRVIAITEGTATIVLSDETALPGDEVSILDENGNPLGKTTLSVHSALKVTGYQGLAEEINVEVGDEVEAGDALITLSKAERSAEYAQLVEERDELTAHVEKLFALYESGEIRAEESGEISGLNEDIVLENDESDDADTLLDYVEEGAGEVVFRYNAYALPEEEDAGEAPNQPGEPAQAPEGGNDGGDAQGDGTVQGEEPMQGDDAGQDQMQDPTSGEGQSQMPGGSGFGDAMGSMPSGGSGFGGGDFGGGSGNGGATGTDTMTADTQNTKTKSGYTISESEICQISPRETMSIEISVDELDIRGLAVGQKVTITLDAIAGQSFDGEITEIGSEGTYDTGNTKYAVTISVPRTEQMWSGMNAGIRVELGEATSSLTVPVAALLEKDGKTYVYTIYNEEKDTLDGLTEVTTGLSDGTDVEIVSGLSEDAKIYYRYADSLEYTFVLPK
ncbi:MAG: HlyD family efflux transporter periplasmic adaptor subunit [Clostridiales bacterium]|nr:HlyD family efflux transporter periplasmic adaptor subunit [Clostridiales bacterium]